ncbi:MAG: DUF1588 domain-containing protein [Myxococcota bacterium]
MRSPRRSLAPLLFALLASCSGTPPEPADRPDGDFVSPTEHLVRASLSLRGVRPSLEELEAVERAPDELETQIDAWLESPQFGEVVRHMHDEWLLADVDNNYYPMGFPARGPLADRGAWAVNESISEAPARLAEYIVVTDRPYTELVTADYTLANDVVATVWGLPYDEEAGGWQVTTYEDGRPHAGVLSDPWLHVRHASTETNRQRSRAAHLSRALLCHDYMKREVRVPLETDLTAGGRNAIEENPVCVSCHHTLDPLGAAFAPYRRVIVPQYTFRYPIAEYDPALAADYAPPRFYGEPVADIYDLGQQIAEDSRFWRCSIRRFAGQLLTQPAEDVDNAIVDAALPRFVDAGFQVRPLVKHLVLSNAFRETAPRGIRRMTPWMVARSIEDLTGFRWTTTLNFGLGFGRIGDVPLLEDVTFGYKTLAGGPDGYDEWDPMTTVDPTTLLALRALAERAAPTVVQADLAVAPTERRLLPAVADDADEAQIREVLMTLHFRLYGERLTTDNPEIDALWDVHQAGGGTANPEAAWTAVVFAMLQHPRILFY